MVILDDIIATLDFNATVRDIRQGVFHTAVLTRNCGLAASLPRDARFGNQKPDVLHRIAPGDSLSTIAARYGTTVSKLMALNGMRNHRIRAGKTLILPGNVMPEPGLAGRSGAESPAGKGHVEYVIRRGDSLWSIARRFNVSQQQLVAWNDISPKGYIQPGQKLRVPRSI